MEARGASSDCAALAAAISSSVPGLGYSHASGASTMVAFSACAGSCEDKSEVTGVSDAQEQLESPLSTVNAVH